MKKTLTCPACGKAYVEEIPGIIIEAEFPLILKCRQCDDRPAAIRWAETVRERNDLYR